MKKDFEIRCEQTKANILAYFCHYKLRAPKIIGEAEDRTFFEYSSSFMASLKLLQRFLLYKPRFHGPTAKESWREDTGRYSMHVIVHSDGRLEIDYDPFNPRHGLFFAIPHLFEILTPGKTDPWRVMRGLRGRGIPAPDIREGI